MGHTHWWNSVHDHFFSVHISAESHTLNLFYVISKLQCKIDQVS